MAILTFSMHGIIVWKFERKTKNKIKINPEVTKATRYFKVKVPPLFYS